MDHATLQCKPRVGISACLLGANVRYNGGHKQHRYCQQTLARYMEFVTFCPEVGIGLPVPRPAIRLVKDNQTIRVVERHDQRHDHGPALKDYARQKQAQIEPLSGFVFMQKSPTCGLGSATLYTEKGMPLASRDGAFSEQVQALNPNLPVTEAGRLNDHRLRENFILQVYAYHDFQQMVQGGLSLCAFQAFHRRYKVALNSHCQQRSKELGRMLASAGGCLDTVAENYLSLFMQTMRKIPQPRHHATALTECYRTMKRQLDNQERQTVLDLIERYRLGSVPLIVPLTLMKFLRDRITDLPATLIDDLYPPELGLQNAI